MKKVIFSLMFLCSSFVDAEDKITSYIQETYNISRVDAFAIHTYARTASKTYNVPLPTILAIIATESSFKNYTVSNKSSSGLMQIHPSSGVKIKNVFNPRENILKGTKLFADYYQKLGYDKAIHAYNLGITKVKNGKRNKKYSTKIHQNEKIFISLIQK